MSARNIFAVVLLVTGAPSCAKSDHPPEVRVSFDDLITSREETRLNARATSLDPSTIVVRSESLLLADTDVDTIEIFNRRDGSLEREIPLESDSASRRVHPSSIVAIDSGRLAVLDRARPVIFFYDSLGHKLDVLRLPSGGWGNLTAIRGERRLLVTGFVVGRSVPGPRSWIYELDYSGRVVRSYRRIEKVSARRQASFNMPFTDQIPQGTLSASALSNEVQIYNRRTGGETRFRVAPQWYKEVDWIGSIITEQTTPPSKRMAIWLHGTTLLSGVIALTNGRFLTRFTSYLSDGTPVFRYALADTGGRTIALSLATRRQIVRSAGDTVYWLAKTGDGGLVFGSGIVGPLHK